MFSAPSTNNSDGARFVEDKISKVRWHADGILL